MQAGRWYDSLEGIKNSMEEEELRVRRMRRGGGGVRLLRRCAASCEYIGDSGRPKFFRCRPEAVSSATLSDAGELGTAETTIEAAADMLGIDSSTSCQDCHILRLRLDARRRELISHLPTYCE